MQRRTYLSRLGILGAAGLAGCLGDSDGGGTPTAESTPTVEATGTEGTPAGSCGDGRRLTNGDFTCGTYAWTVGADVPTDPETGDPVATDVAVTGFGEAAPPTTPDGGEAEADEHVLALSIDGRQAAGTLWVAQAADLADCETLAVDVYSEGESGNTVTNVAAYAGPQRDLGAADFDASRALETHAGWETFSYSVDHDAEGLVAVGIDVAWETEVTRYLDHVRLR